MPYILHMSDFHYTGNPSERTALEEKLKSLAGYIKDRRLDVKYLVCTGDFIEQKLLINAMVRGYCEDHGLDCPEEKDPDKYRESFLKMIGKLTEDEPIQDYNYRLVDAMKELYEDFSDLLKDFMSKIGIDNHHLVVCCGNHDKTWIQKNKATKNKDKCATFNLTGNRVELIEGELAPTDDERCYEAFDYFCREMGIDYNHNTFVHDYDSDVEFLIMNSNYGADNRDRLCINCLSLNDKFFNINTHKNHSVLVMHAPFRSLCEYFDMNYGKEVDAPIMSALLNNISFCMCGDKHTNDRRSINDRPVFMAGKFAYDEDLNTSWNCRIIKYDDKERYLDSPVVFSEGRWHEYVGIKETIETCLRYGDESNIKKLIGEHEVLNPASVLTLRKKEYINSMSDIIKAVCVYQLEETPKVNVSFEEGTSLFDYLFSRFQMMLEKYQRLDPWERQEHHVLLKLVGNIGVGKSSFLYALWYEMLYKYMMSDKSFLPLVFDFSRYSEKDDSDIAIVWKSFLRESKKLSDDLKIPVVCFVDGLYAFTLSDRYKEFMKSIKKDFQSEEKLFFVISVDRYRESYSYSEKARSFADDIDWRGNDYMRINYVDIYRYEDPDPQKELERSVRNSIELSGRSFNSEEEKKEYSKDTVDFLQKIGYNEVSLSTLKMIINSTLLDAWHRRESENRDKERARKLFYRMLRERWKQDLSRKDLLEAAYKISYGEIKNMKKAAYLDRLAMDADHRNFLCAEYVCNSILADEGFKLSWPVSHSVAVLVQSAIQQRNYTQSRLLGILEEIIARCEGNVSLIIVYLIGTLFRREKRNRLLDMVLEKAQVSPFELIKEYDNESYKRVITHFFASFLKLYGSDSEQQFNKLKEDFFSELVLLIRNRSFMKYYRIFMLDYYGDLSHNRLTVREAYEKEVKDGAKSYDFNRCFTSLAANIKEGTAEFPDEYIVLLLCEIVYSRLKESADNPNEDYYFNSSVERYNYQKNILNITIECIEKILKRDRNNTRNLQKLKDTGDIYNLYYRYLTTMYYNLKDCLRGYKYPDPERADDAFLAIRKTVSPAWAFETGSDLKWQPRAGWFYRESPGYTKNDKKIQNKIDQVYKNNKKDYFPDTIAEHCFECMLIAEMYLPDTEAEIRGYEKDLDTSKYDKNTVIRILLTFEIGKAKIGDRPEQHIQAREKNVYYEKVDSQMYRLIFNEVLSGYTSGGTTEFLQSKVKFAGNSHDYDYNEKLAKDIDIIHREYMRIKYAKKLKLSDSRNEDFEQSQAELDTEYGKKLLEILVTDNPFLGK